MEQNRDSLISTILVESMNKLPQMDYAELKRRLNELDEDSLYRVMGTTATFKNPVVALIISIFIGGLGIDRFYVGDVGLGILKLITLGGFGIWTLIDWFIIMGRAKKVNLNKLSAIL